MKLIALFFTLFIKIVFTVFAHNDHQVNSVYGMQGIRISCDTQWKHDYLMSFKYNKGFDFLKFERDFKSNIDVLVVANETSLFKQNLDVRKIKYEVIVEDMSDRIRNELDHLKKRRQSRQNRDDILEVFPDYNEIQAYLQHLNETYSAITHFSLGKSYENREISCVKISSGGFDKPILFIDAGIHAREWIAPSTAIYAIQQLAENASNSYLFENVDIYIVPSLNPDGYDYTHQSIQSRMWRKTRSINLNSECLGVDGNRNFDIQWMTVGASNDPCTDIYAGPTPFSEPETVALRNFFLANKNKIKIYITLHSYGQYLLHPWGYTPELPRNEPTLRCVAEKAAASLSTSRGTKYTIGSSTNVLYPAAGGSDDYAHAFAGVELAYTMELPAEEFGFAPPPSEIKPIGFETFEAIKEFISYINTGKC